MIYNYIVITPIRDEAKYIGRTIESMICQTCLPKKWVIVNDGSTDDTPRIIDAVSKQYPWIFTIHRPNRGFRKSGGGVVDAFYDGYRTIKELSWEYLVKLDGDLSFDSDYFQQCFEHFILDPFLGIGGGTVFSRKNGQLKIDSIGDPPFHVRGATKIYRNECWKKINPLVKSPGWDTIDEVKANMYGWKTRTFQKPIIIQHKATGSADGNWKNWFKNGLGSYITGYHPVFFIAKCFKRMVSKPLFIASLGLFTGYFYGYINNTPQIKDKKAIYYLRNQQMRRLLFKKSIYR